MLTLLTDYFLRYKKLNLPGVGTLRLVQKPAQLNVAEKRIEPPRFFVEKADGEAVSDHQLAYLQTALAADRETVQKELGAFGETVRRQMGADGFDWKGIGRFSEGTTSLALPVTGLQAVAAEKVVRADADHTVLVGDREMNASQRAEQKAGRGHRRKRPVAVVAGWVLLMLAIAAIALVLFFGGFQTSASGSKLPATVDSAR